MKALLLDAAPEGDTVVVPVGDPLWVPGFVDANARCYRAAPYAGRVALSVPCGPCEGAGLLHATADEQRIMAHPSLRIHRCLFGCKGLGRLIWGTAMVKFVQRPPFSATMSTHGVRHVWTTPGRWGAVLTDVRPTTERCPACWRTADLPGHVTRKGWCEPCLCLGKTPPIPHDGSQEWEP